MNNRTRLAEKVTAILIAACLIPIVTGCSLRNRLAPLPKRFLEDVDTTKKIKSLPFDHSAVWKNTTENPGDALYISDVSISRIPEDSWSDSSGVNITSQEEFTAKAEGFASYFKERLTEYLRGSSKINLVDTPAESDYRIEIALTELRLARPVLTLASAISPVPGSGVIASELSDPHATFAMRIIETSTGDLVATIADRKFPPVRIVDLNKFTASSSVREIIDNWAAEISDAFLNGRLNEISSRGGYSLLPW